MGRPNPDLQSRGGVGPVFIVLLLCLAGATAAAVILSDGNPAAALGPVLLLGVLYLVYHLPLRYLGLSLLFLGLVMENPGEIFASGQYKSPIYIIGWLLLAHWNLTIPIKPLIFSGVDAYLILIFVLAHHRRSTGSRIDGGPFVETASPMRWFAWVAIAGPCLLEVWGMAHGGMDFADSLWQFERAAYLPAIFLAFHFAFRGPQDHVAIGKVVIAAGTVRAATAWAIRHFITPNDIEMMPTATTHSDSILFACAFCLCITLLLEIPSRKHKILALAVLPILVGGMMANNRRIVWVEVVFALAIPIFMMPMTPLKRKLLRYVLIAAPIVAIYLTVGWGKSGGIWRGAATLRSLVDSKTDASTKWREFENYDLIATLQSSPVLGLGYGHKYIGPADVEDVYPQEHYLPHNSLLGVWAFGGVGGFTMMWLFLAVGAFIGARVYYRSTRRIDRVAALMSLETIMIYINQAYGDLGLGTMTGLLLTAASLSVVGKLGLTTGAWPAKVKANAGVEVKVAASP